MPRIIPDDDICTLQDLVTVTGLSTRRIQQLVDEGVMFKGGRGQYLFAKSLKSYIEFVQKPIVADEEAKLEKAKATAEIKYKKAKADRATMETEELRGNMHRSDDVRAITEDMLYAIRNGLVALPGRLAVDVASCQTAAEAYEVIKREVHVLMREIAEYKYDPGKYDEAVRDRMAWNAAHDSGDDPDD